MKISNSITYQLFSAGSTKASNFYLQKIFEKIWKNNSQFYFLNKTTILNVSSDQSKDLWKKLNILKIKTVKGKRNLIRLYAKPN